MTPAQPTSLTPHILVVDDDARIRSLLERFLKREGFVIITAENAAYAREIMPVYAFDLIILDIMMPGEDGLSLAKFIRSHDTEQPLLLLTALGETQDRIKGLEVGADDYLGKPFEPRELLLRINAILKRRPQADKKAEKLFLGQCTFDFEKEILYHGSNVIPLTTSETRLLKILADSPNTVFSREDLLEQARIEGNERTVDVQVTRLRRKIETDPKAPIYLQTVRSQGYILKPDK